MEIQTDSQEASRLQVMGLAAKEASYQLATCPTTQKNQALLLIADQLEAHSDRILTANALDLSQAKQAGMTAALMDRLMLNQERLVAIANDVRKVVSLDDPIGSELDCRQLENGLRLSRRRVPLGVVGVIYEARPNVTIDIAALCIKTGNASILRGGKETFYSNMALVEVIQYALHEAGLPKASVQYIEQPDRSLVAELLKLDQYVDMIIPRGGASLHQMCKENSTIPVIIGGFGISHTYVDQTVDLDAALAVIMNAKMQRPSACNALDTLLVAEAAAASLLPLLAEAANQQGLALRACERSLSFLSTAESCTPVEEGDFDTEWLAYILGVKLVQDVDEAIAHMRQHNASHSDAILSNDFNAIERFVNAAGSAAVYVNASTRFTDGGQFGLGAEVAVSTQKLHARGPMGLEELTSYKWIGVGDMLVRP